MPFGVAAAAIAVGAGAAAGSGIMSAQGASSAGAYERAGAAGGQAIIGSQLNQLQALYNPFIQAGVGANAQLQSLLYSPQQLENVLAQQEAQLKAQAPVMQKTPKGRHMEFAWQAAQLDYANKLQAWRQRYNTFKTQANLLREQSKANAAGQSQQIEQSPLYQYQARLTNQALAKQGLLGSQEAIRQHGGLTASTYAQYINQLTNLSAQGLNATQTYGANATNLTAMMAGFQQSQQHAQAQSSLGQAQAIAGMSEGIGSAINNGLSLAGNYGMFQQYMGALQQRNAPVRTPAQQANVQGAFNGLGVSGGMNMNMS